jgi:hypothetical protein
MMVALEARTHDPFWMLARQWQLGELRGDDAGSPILATITSRSLALDRSAGPSGTSAPIPASTPVEAWIEPEPVRPAGARRDYRQSAEAGLHFLRLLRSHGVGQYGADYVAHYAIQPPAAAERASIDAPALRFVGVVAHRVPDGTRLAAELRAARPGLPATPTIADIDRANVAQAADEFLAWYDTLFDEPAGGTTAWVTERMEYQFAIDATATDTPCAFVAPQYGGEPLDWTSFDRAPSPLGPVNAPPPPVTRRMVPSPVTFKGMPARRFWELEDANVDLGAIEAGPADLARLMLREFALVYGNDWFIVPLTLPVGSVCRIDSLVVSDTFGVSQTIPHYSETSDGGRWRMFAVSGDTTDHRLVVPPVLARGLAGEPVEQVLLVRDEAANIAWGVERLIEGASGAVIDRPTATAAASVPGAPQGGTTLRYRLGTSVPEYYIPFLPKAIDGTQRRMQRAAFLRTDGTPGPITPLGRLLAPDVSMFEEEFVREGIRLERVYRLARWTDGSTHLWVARRKQIGATAGSSGLQFDRLEFG